MVFAAEIEPRSELLDLGARAVWCAPGQVARCDVIAVPDASFARGGGDRAGGQVIGVAERADPMATVGESDAEPGANFFGQMIYGQQQVLVFVHADGVVGTARVLTGVRRPVAATTMGVMPTTIAWAFM